MAGFREQFINGVRLLSNVSSTKLLMRLSGQSLVLPFYHAISNRSLPHIKHLYSVKSKTAFIRDLDFLLKNFQPISLNDLVEHSSGDKRISQPSFLLSFDDGLKEFYEIIAPVLKKKGIPSICFLNSKFVDNRDLFFRYKASLLIEQFEKYPELIPQSSFSNISLKNIKSKILGVKYDKKEVLDEWAQEINFDFGTFLEKEKPYLTATQIKELQSQGFEFGAHSVDHPEYQFLNIAEQLSQTKESVLFLKDYFQVDHNSFSFPFTDYGVKKGFFDNLQEEKIADITFACAGLKIESVTNHFQRIPFEMDALSAKQIINGELLYFLLKQPFGKNRIQRK